MAKKHLFSVHSDFKTGFFCRFLLILGCILFVLYLVQMFFHALPLSEDDTGAILAFSILCLGVGIILYFFTCQFAKLSRIATEIESDETLMDDQEKKNVS